MQVIERDTLTNKAEILYQHTESGKIIPWSAVRVCEINNIKTVEAEPVRHGEWVRNDLGETYCSECHSRIPYIHCYDFYPDCCMDDEDMQWDEEIERTNYCPHCGAKMDLEV